MELLHRAAGVVAKGALQAPQEAQPGLRAYQQGHAVLSAWGSAPAGSFRGRGYLVAQFADRPPHHSRLTCRPRNRPLALRGPGRPNHRRRAAAYRAMDESAISTRVHVYCLYSQPLEVFNDHVKPLERLMRAK